MVMSKQMITKIHNMHVVDIDQQILFLCAHDRYENIVDDETIYQQYKSAVILKDDNAISILKNVMLKWLSDNTICQLNKAIMESEYINNC